MSTPLNTRLATRLVAAASAAVATFSLLTGVVSLAGADAPTEADATQTRAVQPAVPVVVAAAAAPAGQ